MNSSLDSAPPTLTLSSKQTKLLRQAAELHQRGCLLRFDPDPWKNREEADDVFLKNAAIIEQVLSEIIVSPREVPKTPKKEYLEHCEKTLMTAVALIRERNRLLNLPDQPDWPEARTSEEEGELIFWDYLMPPNHDQLENNPLKQPRSYYRTWALHDSEYSPFATDDEELIEYTINKLKNRAVQKAAGKPRPSFEAIHGYAEPETTSETYRLAVENELRESGIKPESASPMDYHNASIRAFQKHGEKIFDQNNGADALMRNFILIDAKK